MAADIAVGAVASRFPALGTRVLNAAAAGKSTSTAAVRVSDFANDRKAFAHYAKHTKGVVLGAKGRANVAPGGADLPELLDLQTYRLNARKMMGGGAPDGVIEGIRPRDGAIVRLDPSTGYFGVRTPDGIIRTFFRPDDPVAYYWSQFRNE